MSKIKARVREPYILCSKDDCDRAAVTIYLFWGLDIVFFAGCYKHSLLHADQEFSVAVLRFHPWRYAANVLSKGTTWVALLQWLGVEGCNALDQREDVRDGR